MLEQTVCPAEYLTAYPGTFLILSPMSVMSSSTSVRIACSKDALYLPLRGKRVFVLNRKLPSLISPDPLPSHLP